MQKDVPVDFVCVASKDDPVASCGLVETSCATEASFSWSHMLQGVLSGTSLLYLSSLFLYPAEDHVLVDFHSWL